MTLTTDLVRNVPVETKPAIAANNVSKRYGKFQVLESAAAAVLR